MEHLNSEQLFQIALDQREELFESQDSEPINSSRDSESMSHLQECLACRGKLEHAKKKFAIVPTLGVHQFPEGLALQTFAALKEHSTLVHSRKLFHWIKFSRASRTLILSAAVVFISFGLFTPKLSEAKTIASQDACKSHLKTLYQAVVSYTKTHGEYPPTNRTTFLTTLYKTKVLKDPQTLLCPGAHCFGSRHPWLGPEINENTTYPSLIEKDQLGSTGYEGRYFPINLEQLDGHFIPIIWDKAGNHEDGRNILFLDGHIEFISEEKFQKIFQSKFHDYPIYMH